MVNLETILETLERCSISSYNYQDESDDDFEVQDVVISCSTEDCKILSQSHELLIDAVLENYEFTKIVVILSTKDQEWIESFRVNYTEIDEDEIAEIGEIEGIEEPEKAKPHRFRTLKKIQSKQKINLLLVCITEHFYSLMANIVKILCDL